MHIVATEGAPTVLVSAVTVCLLQARDLRRRALLCAERLLQARGGPRGAGKAAGRAGEDVRHALRAPGAEGARR